MFVGYMVEGYIIRSDRIKDSVLPDYDNLTHRMKLICYKNKYIRLSELGRSNGSQGDQHRLETVPIDIIYAIDFFPQKKKKGQICIVAGHHVTEPTGIIASLKFAEMYKDSNLEFALHLKKHYQVTVVPIIDVDEYKKKPEERATYRKLNLHYNQVLSFLLSNQRALPNINLGVKPKKSPTEVWQEELVMGKMVYDRINKNVPFIGVDLHESGKNNAGFFIYSTPLEPNKLFDELILEIQNRLKSEGLSIDSEISKHRSNNNGGSFDEFIFQLGGIGYTFESPLSGQLEDRVKMHMLGIDELINQWVTNIEMNRI